MKHAIILSCNTGQGHNSCAEAIREELERAGGTCEIRDSLEFISGGFSRFMAWGHSFMYKYIPWLFQWGYSFSEDHPGLLRPGSPMYAVLTCGVKRLRACLAEGGYDTVICTHMFPALALTKLMREDPLPVRTAFVNTDYTGCPGTESCGLDRYFLACPCDTGVYAEDPAVRDRSVLSGIPVRSGFWSRVEKEEARRRLGLDVRRRQLLMMCGSMGCGPIFKLLGQVTGDGPELEATVVCGTNEKLRRRLAETYKDEERVHILGYTDEIPLYMDAADLYLTKPGGISVTEAAAKELPMAFINTVSGCEKYNMDFFIRLGAAVTDSSIEGLAGRCVELLRSEEELGAMRRALEDYRQPNGARIIVEELSKGIRPC